MGNEVVDYYKPSFPSKRGKKPNPGQEHGEIENQPSAEKQKVFNFHKMDQVKPKPDEVVIINAPANDAQMKNNNLNIKPMEEIKKPERKEPILNREENIQDLGEFLASDSAISSRKVEKEPGYDEFDDLAEISID